MLHGLATRVALVLARAVTAAPIARTADNAIFGNQLVVKNPEHARILPTYFAIRDGRST